jgi:hypothetical protein
MPSKLKAGGSFPYVLPEERGDDKPAVFMVRVLSCLEEAELKEVRDRYFERTVTDESESDMLGEMLRISLESHNIEGQPDDPRAFLTSKECFSIVAGAIEGATLSADERKKFVLLPASVTECSASDAAAVSV